jgi:hypothetical protein
MGKPTTEEQLNAKLARACEKGRTEEAAQLITEGANPDCSDGWGRPLVFAALLREKPEVALLLIEKGADANRIAEKTYKEDWQEIIAGNSLLIEAAGRGYTDLALLLVEKRADVNAVGNDDHTALHWAAARGNYKLVKALVENGADLEARTDKGHTPAMFAENHRPVREYLRGLAPQPQPHLEQAAESWHLTGEQEVSRVREKPALNRSITEIFNFEARTYTQISENLKTGHESQALKLFDEFSDKKILEIARGELVRLGGKAPSVSASIDKPAI